MALIDLSDSFSPALSGTKFIERFVEFMSWDAGTMLHSSFFGIIYAGVDTVASLTRNYILR